MPMHEREARKHEDTGYTYAKAGGPPAEWFKLTIINLDNNKEVNDVVEVDTEQGSIVVFERDEDHKLLLNEERTDALRKRYKGKFKIVRLVGND